VRRRRRVAQARGVRNERLKDADRLVGRRQRPVPAGTPLHRVHEPGAGASPAEVRMDAVGRVEAHVRLLVPRVREPEDRATAPFDDRRVRRRSNRGRVHPSCSQSSSRSTSPMSASTPERPWRRPGCLPSRPCGSESQGQRDIMAGRQIAGERGRRLPVTSRGSSRDGGTSRIRNASRTG
jgi:hypothetical protein